MNNRISIKFEKPEYGWLPVVFSHNDFKIDFHASNVLNDPIDELIYVTTKLQNYETKRITWWLEVPAYFFDISKNPNNYSLAISKTDDLFDKISEPKVLLAINGNEGEIIEPLRSALKQFASLTFEKSHWYGRSLEEE
ncbi:hypothetical protein I5M27_04095 [Adhaeribacter sp. BT258]|uniref:Uncharacterized protein n=1 Tax=Adhaeribacter terrigena TaxID=2793070 RepID=A0ABS1BYC8_9BACT|nr:hypothetical protein [Adhaeribacter terrigena]MBK0402151.1 hypothetical protein [Adhaeribacter terrigena]